MSSHTPEIVFPEHFGFCGGVAAADQLVEKLAIQAEAAGVAVYGLHEIVHNEDVVNKHEANGVTFVDEVIDIPNGSAAVISAHGVGPEVVDKLKAKDCEVFDATCPLVTHTHIGAQMARRNGEKVIYVCYGKPGEVEKLHDEVAGMVGHLDYTLNKEGNLIHDPIERAYLELDEDLGEVVSILSPAGKYRVITQTTLHADDSLRFRDEIKERILGLQPDASVEFSARGDVCRAVADRQKGVEQLVELKPRRIVVVTDPGSKNGIGYFKLAQQLTEGTETEVYAVANAEKAKGLGVIEGVTAVTASASTPNQTISEVSQVLGYEGSPESHDGVFNLHDAKNEVIASKLAAHTLKLTQS